MRDLTCHQFRLGKPMDAENRSRIKIVVVFITLGLVLFVLSFVALLFFTRGQKERSASVFATSTRNELLIGDYRAAMVHLNIAIKDQFIMLEYLSGVGRRPVFQLGDKKFKVHISWSDRSPYRI